MNPSRSPVLVILRRLGLPELPKTGGFDGILRDVLEADDRGVFLELPLRKSDQGKISNIDLGVSPDSHPGIRTSRTISRNRRAWLLRDLFRCMWELLSLCVREWRRVEVFSADAGSALAIALGRRIGLVSNLIQHIPDFTPSKERFDGRLSQLAYAKSLGWVWNQADLVTVPNARVLEGLQDAYGERHRKVLIVNNSVSLAKLTTSRDRRSECIREEWSNIHLMVMATSSLHPKFEIENAIRSLAADEAFGLVVTGDEESSGYREHLLSVAAEAGVSRRLILTGLISSENLEGLLQHADVGVALYSGEHDAHVRYGDSLKIRQYAARGLLVAATEWVWPMPLLIQAEGGLGIRNPSMLVQEIAPLIEDSKSCSAMRMRAQQWSQQESDSRAASMRDIRRFRYQKTHVESL